MNSWSSCDTLKLNSMEFDKRIVSYVLRDWTMQSVWFPCASPTSSFCLQTYSPAIIALFFWFIGIYPKALALKYLKCDFSPVFFLIIKICSKVSLSGKDLIQTSNLASASRVLGLKVCATISSQPAITLLPDSYIYSEMSYSQVT